MELCRQRFGLERQDVSSVDGLSIVSLAASSSISAMI
jgi:hypothetical protein